MADDKDSKKETTVHIGASLFRSLILDKLRAEIEAKRCELTLAKREAEDLAHQLDRDALGGAGSYWKMAYWKMPYWKMGRHQLTGDVVINPQFRSPGTPKK